MAQDGWKLEQEDPALPPSPPQAPSPCSNNCGFFGSSSTMNLCSSCYRNFLTSKGLASSPAPAAGSSSSSSSVDLDLSSLSRLASPSPYPYSSPSPVLLPPAALQAPSPSQPKQPPSRCFTCRKRVGLMGFKCRCGDVFCSLHRYSDKHNCSFDYKAAGRAAISKANPVVKAEKIEKI